MNEILPIFLISSEHSLQYIVSLMNGIKIQFDSDVIHRRYKYIYVCVKKIVIDNPCCL